MTIDRLDFSNPPPGYTVGPGVGEDAGLWWWVRGPEGDEGHRGDVLARQTEAVADAWGHHKGRHNPPGMWSGFYGRLPDLKVYTPRMGIVRGMECTVEETEHETHEAAQMAGRAAAWARYERAVALTDRIERSDVVLLMFQIVTGGDPWPRCIHWPNHYMEVVEHWIARAAEVLR